MPDITHIQPAPPIDGSSTPVTATRAERDAPLETTCLVHGPDGLVQKVQRLRASLVELSGPTAGRASGVDIPLFRIGSAPGNDLVLPDPTVSRFHAELRVEPTGFLLSDPGSRNGIRVQGVRIREAWLEPGARIDLGHVSLRFDVGIDRYEVRLSPSNRLAGLVGESPAIREIFTILEYYAGLPHTVLIEGESGTGKEQAARALHQLGPRRARAFEVVDCATLPRDLIASELFGHVKGAFTGATSDREGAVVRADKGTLFLDEIGELPLELQAQLLRLVQEREVRPLGSGRVRRVDFRLVAASNRNLAEEVNRGRFREDLFHRLAELRVRMPALRSRPEDIPILLDHFLEAEVKRLPTRPGSLPRFSRDVLERLKSLPWSGNVRQLRAYAMRVVVDAGLRPLTPEDLLAETRIEAPPPEMVPDVSSRINDVLMAGAFGDENHPQAENHPQVENHYQAGKQRLLEQYDRAFILHFLRRASWNVTRAAELAGLHRQAFGRLMRERSVTLEGLKESED